MSADSPMSCRGLRAAGGALLAGLALALPAPARAAEAAVRVSAASLADLPLEALREVVVTTVSRREERLDAVAASVFVISAEDIRRSGATTLPEALRLAPTLNVARADANQYAISARGFNNVLANKLLVLVDGRTLYTPLFSGVFWEAQDVMLEDVERIEVITGPSTALWGSNAVNGLIHVITRSATRTRGGALAAHLGTDERGLAARWGAAPDAAPDASADTARGWRAYAKSYRRKHTRRADGSPVDDAAEGLQAGWRADWAGTRDAVTLQGDLYEGSVGERSPGREFSGANLTARWQRDAGAGRQASVQLVLDHTEREQLNFDDRMDTVDLVGQMSLEPAEGHHLVLGGGLRHVRDRVGQNAALAFIPATRDMAWQRLFAQDQIQLSPALAMTLAASVETNPFSATEVLPSLRLAWSPQDDGVLWGSLSRAVRAPSRVDTELFAPAQPPYAIAGGPNFRSEVSNVLELGWRAQPVPELSYALTVYHAEHRHLRSLTPTPQGLQLENNIRGRTTGLEAWSRWRATERWHLNAGWTLVNERLHVQAGAVDAGGLASLGNSPRHRASLRSSLDLAPQWRWELDARRVGALPNPALPAYTAVDSRLVWAPRPGTEWSLSGTNLFDPSHAEWGAAATRVEFERQLSLRLRLLF